MNSDAACPRGLAVPVILVDRFPLIRRQSVLAAYCWHGVSRHPDPPVDVIPDYEKQNQDLV